MRVSFRWVIALATLSAACGQSSGHAKNYDPTFGTGGSIAGGGAGGMAGLAGAAGSSCIPDPSQGATLSGNVIVYDIKFSPPPHALFVGKADLRATGAPCGIVDGYWDGSVTPADGGLDLFQMEGVKRDIAQWIHIYQTDTSEAVYSTLLKINTLTDVLNRDGTQKQLGFGFMGSADIDAVYAAAGVSWDPAKATVVATVGDGGTLTTAVGDPYVLSGSSWVSGTTADSTGLVVLLNVNAAPFPGLSLAFHADAVGQSFDDNCQVEAGAVTACWLGTAGPGP
jgi:hypothetical protein